MLAAKWNEPKVTSTIFHMVEKHYAIPRAVIFRSECAACLPPRFPPQRATCLLHPAPRATVLLGACGPSPRLRSCPTTCPTAFARGPPPLLPPPPPPPPPPPSPPPTRFSVYVELSFRLQLLPSEVYPHFVRLLQALERTPQEYLGEAQYQAYAAEYLQPRVEPVEPVVEEPAFNER